MPRRTTHIAQKLKAAVTLLLLLLCVCSAVARDTTRVFSKLPWNPNTAGGANGLGGAYVNTYNYDGLYRLTAANGSYSGNNTNYSLEMSYTPAGRLCSKLQDFTATANTYAYSQNAKPHAVRRYYNGLTNELYSLLWDANGNLAQQTVYSVNNNVPAYQNMRALYWDEDDRLNLVAGDGYLSYYAYGYDGNRAIKMTGNAAIDQSGTLLNSTNLENITIYPSEYLTVTQAEYTKYYYAGGNRIASKIGTGGFGKMQRLCTQDLNLSANANTLFGNTLQQITNVANQPTDEYPVTVCGGYNVATELLTSQLPDFYISQTNLNFTQNNLLQQFRQNLTNAVEPVYYFHSDHLGSASWITNNTGLPVQHLQYLPFGEHFVNEHSSGYDERFTFTGKERDAETGYYYHGARFNSSDIGWLSVDPMADKYPSISPYTYCAWNPVKLVDPEGEELTDFYYLFTGAHLEHIDDGVDEAIGIQENVYNACKEDHLSIAFRKSLGVSLGKNSEFVDLAGTLYAESTPSKISFEEMAAIGSVIRNRANANNCSLIDIASGGGIYGYDERDKIQSPYANKNKVNLAYKAAMITICTKTDYSDGAYYWQGKDFSISEKKAYKLFYQCGFKFTNQQHDVYKMGDKIGSGKVPYQYESTNGQAGTVFFRLTKEWKKANGATKWNGS